MAASYPILLDLAGRPTVVAGGGPVAERKVHGLLAAGATVRLVSPEVTPGLAHLARRGEIVLETRPWRPGDLDGAMLGVAATGDPAVNARVAEEGRSRGVLVNRVDDPDRGGFTVPAVLRRGDLTVAVATSGRTPGLAGALRRRLEGVFGPEWAELVELFAADRGSLPRAADQAAWDGLLGPDVLEAVRSGQPAVVRERIRACRSSSSA